MRERGGVSSSTQQLVPVGFRFHPWDIGTPAILEKNQLSSFHVHRYKTTGATPSWDFGAHGRTAHNIRCLYAGGVNDFDLPPRIPGTVTDGSEQALE